MGAPQYEQAGADIGGSGTTNTIPRWTGASTLGDSGLIDDSTSIYTSTRRVGVDTSTTLTNIKLQVGTAASLANYQGAPLGVVLPAGSGSWLELAENSASGTSFRISKDSSTGVVLNTNGKTIGFTAAGYTTAVASSQVVLTTSGALLMAGNGGAANPIIANSTGVSGMYFPSATTVAIAANGSIAATFSKVAGAGVALGGTTGLVFDASGTQQGLKLPATPGNADTQTLDCYQEGTWSPTLTAFDGTAPTATTARYTRIGRVVYFEVVLSATGAANFGSTWGNTKVSLPFAPANTIAIPINRNAIGSCGTTSGSDILLTTYAQNAETMRLTGFFSV